jgi:uncharacterized SAM-binding protein YcdF (DUF218 family)
MRELLSYSFALPPTIFIAVSVAGALIALFRPLIGIKIVLANASIIYLCATPVVSAFLLQQLVSSIPTNVDLSAAQAIVVPGADIRLAVDRFSHNSVGPLTLERLATAAQLYRRLHVPIAVSGGAISHSPVPLATLMRDSLERDFSTPVTFAENTSHNTFENALLTQHILSSNHITTVIIVVQARDMLRALWSFDRASLHALPYCTDSCRAHPIDFFDVEMFLPSATAFCDTYFAFHELIGLLYYMAVY